MSKIKMALNVVEDLRNLANSIEILAQVAERSNKQELAKPQEEKINIPFEDLRAVLAALTREGKQKEVKELITSYGANKLSDIPEEKYKELLEEAGKL